METLISHSIVSTCPVCGMRRRWGGLRHGLELAIRDLMPTFYGCFNAKGQRGFRWRELQVGPSTYEATHAHWQHLKASVTARMLSWLERFATDFNGDPLLVQALTPEQAQLQQSQVKMAAALFPQAMELAPTRTSMPLRMRTTVHPGDGVA